MDVEILAVSDEVDQRIYSSTVKERMGDVAFVVSCGDVPASYLEFLCDALNRPVYYVLGNHAEELTRAGERGHSRHPLGAVDLGWKVITDPATGLILAGLPGSIRYSAEEPVQYTELQMIFKMLRMSPRLLWNRFRHGRAMDILVTHSPPRWINDCDDPAHQGFVAMRRFLKWFRPRYQLHGHIHLYDRSKEFRTHYLDTEVINVYPYQRLDLTFDGLPETAERDDAAVRASGPPGLTELEAERHW